MSLIVIVLLMDCCALMELVKTVAIRYLFIYLGVCNSKPPIFVDVDLTLSATEDENVTLVSTDNNRVIRLFQVEHASWQPFPSLLMLSLLELYFMCEILPEIEFRSQRME